MKKLTIGLAAFLMAATNSLGLVSVNWNIPEVYLNEASFKSVALVCFDPCFVYTSEPFTIEKNSNGKIVLSTPGASSMVVATAKISDFNSGAQKFYFDPDFDNYEITMKQNADVGLYFEENNELKFENEYNSVYTAVWPVGCAYIFFDEENIDEANNYFFIYGKPSSDYQYPLFTFQITANVGAESATIWAWYPDLQDDEGDWGHWNNNQIVFLDYYIENPSYSFTGWTPLQIPEPTTALLFAAGAAVAGLRRRRRG